MKSNINARQPFYQGKRLIVFDLIVVIAL